MTTAARHNRGVPDRGVPPVVRYADIACTPDDNDDFYPEDRRGRRRRGKDDAAAKRICRRCPHVQECLAWAVETRQQSGIWGGKNPREREAMLKEIKSTTRTPS